MSLAPVVESRTDGRSPFVKHRLAIILCAVTSVILALLAAAAMSGAAPHLTP